MSGKDVREEAVLERIVAPRPIPRRMEISSMNRFVNNDKLFTVIVQRIPQSEH